MDIPEYVDVKKRWWEMANRRDRGTKTSDCVHHWQIAIANGPVSHGKCKLCKAEKDFLNSIFAERQHINLIQDQSIEDRKGRAQYIRWNEGIA